MCIDNGDNCKTREFSHKCIPTLEILEKDILDSKYTYTDETGTKFNGKNMYVRNYSNENTVIYKAHKNKGHSPIQEDNIPYPFLWWYYGRS